MNGAVYVTPSIDLLKIVVWKLFKQNYDTISLFFATASLLSLLVTSLAQKEGLFLLL